MLFILYNFREDDDVKVNIFQKWWCWCANFL